MGIESFFSSLRQNYKNQIIISSETTTNINNELLSRENIYNKIQYMFFDFNSIIHNISAKLLSNKSSFEQATDKPIEHFEMILIEEIFKFLNRFLIDLKNLKLIYIAIDGVPTKGKIMEQKKRRYNATFLEMFINRKLNIKDEEFWSKNNISPGTYFMDKLSNKLKELSDVKSDKYKQIISYSTKIIIDDYHNFGEGEIKIMSWRRENDATRLLISNQFLQEVMRNNKCRSAFAFHVRQ